MLFGARRGLQFRKQRQRLGGLTTLFVGKSEAQLGTPVACLHCQRFLEFTNAVTCAPDSHQNCAQSAVSLLKGRRKTNHLLEFFKRGIEIIAGESSHPGSISGVSLLQARQGLLRTAHIREGQKDGENTTSQQPRFERIL